MNILSKNFVAIRKILYYNKSFCCNTEKYYITTKCFVAIGKKIIFSKSRAQFPHSCSSIPLSIFSLINNAISSFFSHQGRHGQGPCAHTSAAHHRCQSDCDSLSLLISSSPRLSLFIETP